MKKFLIFALASAATGAAVYYVRRLNKAGKFDTYKQDFQDGWAAAKSKIEEEKKTASKAKRRYTGR